MPFRSYFISSSILLLILIISVQADDHNTTKHTIFISNGHLYSFMIGNDSPTQLTDIGYNSEIVVSPTGDHIAFLQLAPHVIMAHENGNYTFIEGRPNPQDIWLYDRVTGEFTQITTQENRNEDGFGVARSRPTWSPDGAQLAWFEFETYEQGMSLIVYDLLEQRVGTLDDTVQLGFSDGGDFYLPDDLGWGQYIAHSVFTYDVPSSEAGAGELVEFRDDDVIVNSVLVRSIIHDEIDAVRWHWVQHNDRWLYALYGLSTGWQLIDPTTGDRYQLQNPPFMQTNNSSLQIIWTPDQWLARLDDGTEITVLEVDAANDIHQVTFDPAGTAIQYIEDGQIYSWSSATGTRLILPSTALDWYVDEMVTVPTIWYTDGNATPLPAPDPPPSPTTNDG